ncbi:hypothetical protein AB4145_01880 [Vibrio splendidus]
MGVNLIEKEIELIEDSLEKFRVSKRKYDSTSSMLMLSSILLFSTSEPESVIKLIFLGVQLKSIYAVYMLFLFSIISAGNYVLLFTKNSFLSDRYKTLLKERYGGLPESLSLIDSGEYEIRKMLFTGRWNIINRMYHCLVTLPFLLSYFYLAYQLVTFSQEFLFESISSFLIIVFGFYLIVSLCRAIYVNWKINNVQKTPTEAA